jgi:hypothetical protein
MVKDPNRVDPQTGEMEATLFKAMENEHADPGLKDTQIRFKSTNGVETTSAIEWEIVVHPNKKHLHMYPERDGFRDRNPELCRKYISLEEMKDKMTNDTNKRLIKHDHAPMIEEELIAGRLYTGPM